MRFGRPYLPLRAANIGRGARDISYCCSLSLSLSLATRKSHAGYPPPGDAGEEAVRLCVSSYFLERKTAAGVAGPKRRSTRFSMLVVLSERILCSYVVLYRILER